MHFIATLVAGAACATVALAQVNIAFTSVPAVVVAGQQYNITWGGGDDSDVTLTLRQGDPNDLETISTLTSTGSDGFYLWTPDRSLDTASDYALQITQGQSDINYSGPFALVGGAGSSSISFSGTTASATETESSNSTITSSASSGTSTPISRNTTFSSQSLTSTSERSSRSSRSSPTAAETSVETSAPNSGAAQVASSIALVFGIMAAVMSLN